MKPPIDALVFDMDGTLWDAIPSYCKVWDVTAAELGVTRKPVQYDELVSLMGKPLLEIYRTLMGTADDDPERFMAKLTEVETRLMPMLGGKLYPGVRETLRRLSSRVKLFMVSNCTGRGLDNFVRYNRLDGLFTELLSYGATGVDKNVNLKALIKRYNLRRPLYVGDIQRDSDSSHAAGVEFVWAAYGFGEVRDADYRINKFEELEEKVLKT